jgi:SHS2 domain-containing protein
VTKRFTEIDHSGDVGIEVWGASIEEVIENITLGLFSLMVRGTVGTDVRRELSVASRSQEDLLVDWLSEVIATAATHCEVYGSVELQVMGSHELTGVIRGEAVQPERHDLRFEVKAATYHGLLFERLERGYHALVIFDL